MRHHPRFWAAATFVFVTGWAAAQTTSPTYTPGVTFQNFNPNYPKPNPFYFEGKIDWAKLGITQPSNAWEYEQRAIHEQDELGDTVSAMKDYEQALAMNSLAGDTCQLVTAATFVNGALPATLNPAPCMFTLRLRMAYLLRQSNPARAITLYNEVL